MSQTTDGLELACAYGGSAYPHRGQGSRWQAQEESEWQAQQAQAPPPRAPEPQTSAVEQLKELGELKAQGILTEQQFAQQKAKILRT